jgi:UV damage endonuclease UvdE
MSYRIGFACKYLDPQNNKEKEKQLNTKTTTAKWLRDNPSEIESKIFGIVAHNLKAINYLLQYVNTLPDHLKAVRISSDILPMYTHFDFKHIYTDSTLSNLIETSLENSGNYARSKNIRVSMHPGQWTVLASENPNIVNNSIAEFEYHTYLLRSMGYGRTFQDAKCNVHISGKLGYQGMLAAYKRLSPEARNLITIENEEITHGLDQCLLIANTIPVVLDVHHHYINTGEYINITDDRVKRAIDSWRGVRPMMHLSQSREDILVDHCKMSMPILQSLLKLNYKKQKLRAHSDYMWNKGVNKWSHQFLEYFDVMIEAKAKNLASIKYYEELNGNN